MSRTKALKRLGVSAVCAVTVFGLVPALTAPAQANHTTTAISLSPDTQSSPAGTCQQFTATVTFNNTNGTDTATVDVLADPRVNETVAFCSLNPNATPANSQYTAPTNGTVITNNGAGGSDNAEFVVTSTNGSTTASVTFGVVSNEAGTVDVTAFLENTATSSGNGIPDGTELRDVSVATYTDNSVNAVTSVDAEPETGAAVQGQQYQFVATLKNSAGQPISGAQATFDVTAGPDAAIGPTNCAVSDQLGRSVCTLTGGGTSPGTDTIRVYVNQADSDSNPLTLPTNGADSGEPFDDITVTFGAPQAAGTTVVLTCASVRTNNAGTTCQNPISESSEVFTALVRNAAGTALAGVPVTFTLTPSPQDADNTPSANTETETLSPSNCTTAADGTCTTTLNNTRVTEGEVFTVVARVAVSGGSGNCTADTAGNCATATKTFATAPNTTARILTLTPETQSVGAGGVGALVATLTDRRGIVVPNVQVTFTEVGTGRFTNGSDTFVGTTNSSGQVRAELNTTAGETAGSTTVTATITSPRNAGANNDECENTVNNSGNSTTSNDPGAPAGACSDTATVTFAGASATPTATATSTGTPSPGACTVTPTVSLSPSIITATGASTVTVRATPNSIVDLFAYTRPSTTYAVVRSAEVPGSGTVTFTVTPPRNTRLYAQQRGCTAGGSVVLSVRTALSLNVTRTGTRQYVFSGDSLPARPGGLIISLYRVTSTGQQVLAAQTRANATTGDWVINRTFTGTGRFNFLVKTGADLQNAPGQSNVRNLLVF